MTPELNAVVAECRKSKKIIFLVPRYTFESVSFICFQYVSALRKRGIDARISSLRKATRRGDQMLSEGRWRLFRCDVLVTHLFLPDLAGFLLSRIIPSIQWVPFVHCDIVGGLAAERRPFAKMKARIWRAILYRAEQVISPSRYALRSLPGVKHAAIIPHCIDPTSESAFRDQPLESDEGSAYQTAVSKQKKYSAYVYIGRDTRGKRLSSLLRFVTKDQELRLRVIGTVDYSKSVVNRLLASDLNRCEFLGLRNDPYRHVYEGDIVICPSGREGFGLVPLECMARNIPVVVINEGVFRELYGGTSVVYEAIKDIPTDIGALTKDSDLIREKFIGPAALANRIDQLVAITMV